MLAFFDRLGLPGEWRLVHAQERNLDQPSIGGDKISRIENEQIAAHDLARRHQLGVTVAHDARAGRCHARERGHRSLGPILLEEADRGVQQDDRENRAAVDPLAQRHGHDRGHDQQPDDEAAELSREQREERRATRGPQLVRTIAREPQRCLCARESAAHIGR